jgi:hypothetical protein
LYELRGYLIENGLEQLVSIVSKASPALSDISFETLDPEQTAMWSSPSSVDKPMSSSDGLTTSWSFARAENGDFEIYETKKCVELPSGLHVKVKDKGTAGY